MSDVADWWSTAIIEMRPGMIRCHVPVNVNGLLASAFFDRESGRRVLVPLCGATPDLRWLAERGNDVTGVELSRVDVVRQDHRRP